MDDRCIVRASEHGVVLREKTLFRVRFGLVQYNLGSFPRPAGGQTVLRPGNLQIAESNVCFHTGNNLKDNSPKAGSGKKLPMRGSREVLPMIPLLDVNIDSPCSASWDEMAGDERSRFCDHCQRKVYNLSAMSQNEARALVEGTEGRKCVRFYRREDGTMVTDNCPIALRICRRTTTIVNWLIGGIVLAFFAFLGLSMVDDGDFAEGEPAPYRKVEPFRTILNWIDPTPRRAFQHTMGVPCKTIAPEEQKKKEKE